MADVAVGPVRDGVSIDEVLLDVYPSPSRPGIIIRHARIIVPAATIAMILNDAPLPGGLHVSATLEPGRILIAVRASLLRVRIGFRPTIRDGNLVLTPAGGIPGLLLGLGANLVSGRPGVSMSGDGQIVVDPHVLAPDGVTLPNGISSVTVDPDRMVLTVS